MYLQQKEPKDLDVAIDKAFSDLHGYAASDEKYAKILHQIAMLHKMKLDEQPNRVSRDTLVMAATHLAGIIMIIVYENKHVIASKALNFVPKPR